MSAVLCGLILGAVSLQLGEGRGTDASTEAALGRALARAAGEVSGDVVTLLEARCPSAERARCLAELRAGGGALLSAIAGPTRLRLLVELGDGRSEVLDLPREEARWVEPLRGLARRLFPPAPPPREVSAPVPQAEPSPPLVQVEALPARAEPSLLPWWVIGGGAALLAVASGFEVSSRDARSALGAGPHAAVEHDELVARWRAHGDAAAVLGVAGLVLVVGGAAWLIIEVSEPAPGHAPR